MAHETKNILVNYIHDRVLLRYVSRYFARRPNRLVDIGCGAKPFKELLAPYITEHVGVDHRNTLHNKSDIDIFGTAYQIPEAEASFDFAICTAVLEHLEEPEHALREAFRVLKPDGIAIYSVPFIWHLHEEPRDFYRFSKYGLRYLFEKTGFEILELEALSGFWVTFGQLFVYNLYRFNRGPLRWFRLIDLMGLVIQAAAYGMNRLDKTEEWTWMYMIVAKKPQSVEETP